MRLAVDSHIGDFVEPRLRGGIDGREVGKVGAVQEVLLHEAHTGLDATFLKSSQLHVIRSIRGTFSR